MEWLLNFNFILDSKVLGEKSSSVPACIGVLRREQFRECERPSARATIRYHLVGQKHSVHRRVTLSHSQALVMLLPLHKLQ